MAAWPTTAAPAAAAVLHFSRDFSQLHNLTPGRSASKMPGMTHKEAHARPVWDEECCREWWLLTLELKQSAKFKRAREGRLEEPGTCLPCFRWSIENLLLGSPVKYQPARISSRIVAMQ